MHKVTPFEQATQARTPQRRLRDDTLYEYYQQHIFKSEAFTINQQHRQEVLRSLARLLQGFFSALASDCQHSKMKPFFVTLGESGRGLNKDPLCHPLFCIKAFGSHFFQADDESSDLDLMITSF